MRPTKEEWQGYDPKAQEDDGVRLADVLDIAADKTVPCQSLYHLCLSEAKDNSRQKVREQRHE